MASNSELRGFTIENSGRSGVVLNGIDNALVSNVTVLDAVRNGVQVSNISGSVSVLDTTVNTSGEAALLIENVTGNVSVAGDYTNDSGEALVLDNIGEDAEIDLMEASFSNDTGNGLAFNDVSGTVSLSAVSLVNSNANGIEIDGGTGTIKFAGETVIEGATGDAIRIHNSDAQVEFESLTITDANGNGISIFNNANTASFTVSGLTSITGGTNGIRIRQNEGTVDFDEIEIDGRRLHGILVDGTEGQVNFNNSVTINNSDSSDHSAVEITNSSADVLFVGDVDIADATGDAAVSLTNNTGTTGFANLNVAAENGAGVVAASAGTLRVLEGNIAVEDGSAFDIEDTEATVALTSLSSTNATYGIRLKDHSGEFVVNGIEGEADSGGFINEATTGVFLDNAGTFGLRNVVFNQNATSISANNADQITVLGGSINDSLITIADVTDVRNFAFVETEFSGNVSGLSLLATQDDTYNWVLQSIRMEGTDVPLIARGTGESEVTVGIENSIIETAANNISVLTTTSTNNLNLQLSGNEITSTGDNVTLLNFGTTSDTELAQLTVFNNIFDTTGSSVTAINVATGGPSEVLFSQNTISFAGSRGVGIGFNLAGSATVGLYNNIITDAFDGGTGVLFESVAGPTRIEINGNDLDFANLGGLSDRGFIFETITGDVNLVGTVDNIVGGASTPVFVPSGRTTGSFFVNGIEVP